MFKKFIIVIVLCVVLIFALRNYLAASLIRHYIKKEFDAECTIEKVQVFISGIEVSNLQIHSKDFKGGVEEGSVDLDLHNLFKLKSIEVFFNPSLRIGKNNGQRKWNQSADNKPSD